MNVLLFILIAGFVICGSVIVIRRRRRTKFLENITRHLDLVDARAGYEQSREIVILQMLDPLNSGYTKAQANDHLQRSEAFMNRIIELEGGAGGPDFRLQIHQRLLNEIEAEATWRSRGMVMKGDGGIQETGNMIEQNIEEREVSENIDGESIDPIAEKILAALKQLANDDTLDLGDDNYILSRAPGAEGGGFAVKKVDRQ